jgi:hypothetical protein
MIPFRRFSVFISRICLTFVLILTSLFVIFGFTKYLIKTDTPKYVPIGHHLLKIQHHHHSHGRSHNHDQVPVHAQRRVR